LIPRIAHGTLLSPISATLPPFLPLLFIDVWGTSTGGIASFNMKLARDLASAGIPVTMALTKGGREAVTLARVQCEEAGLQGIAFVEFDTEYSVFVPPVNPASFSVVIGHAPSSGGPAIAAATTILPHCKKWLFLHTAPDWVDHLDHKHESERKNDKVKESIRRADLCFAVGQSVHDYWQCRVDEPSKRKLRLFQPGLTGPATAKSETSVTTLLYIGRTENAASKGLPFLPEVFAAVCTTFPERKFQLIVRGVEEGEEDEVCKLLKAEGKYNVVLRRYLRPAEDCGGSFAGGPCADAVDLRAVRACGARSRVCGRRCCLWTRHGASRVSEEVLRDGLCAAMCGDGSNTRCMD
jgi:hypothetical protein